jgi:hypothetical protein
MLLLHAGGGGGPLSSIHIAPNNTTCGGPVRNGGKSTDTRSGNNSTAADLAPVINGLGRPAQRRCAPSRQIERAAVFACPAALMSVRGLRWKSFSRSIGSTVGRWQHRYRRREWEQFLCWGGMGLDPQQRDLVERTATGGKLLCRFGPAKPIRRSVC